MPPGRRCLTSPRSIPLGSAWWWNTKRPTTKSNGSSNTISAGLPSRNDTGALPRAAAVTRAAKTAAGAISVPTTLPDGPTRSAARKATSPVPLPTSSTRMPGAMPAARKYSSVAGPSSSACRRKAFQFEIGMTQDVGRVFHVLSKGHTTPLLTVPRRMERARVYVPPTSGVHGPRTSALGRLRTFALACQASAVGDSRRTLPQRRRRPLAQCGADERRAAPSSAALGP